MGFPTENHGKIVQISTKEEREVRIKKEQTRLKRIYADVGKDNKAIIDGLIYRASFMRISLEDMETDLDGNGFVEYFTQSERTPPYQRERPVAKLYNTLNKNYQSIIKQLSDLLPKEKAKEVSDGFEDFINAG